MDYQVINGCEPNSNRALSWIHNSWGTIDQRNTWLYLCTPVDIQGTTFFTFLTSH